MTQVQQRSTFSVYAEKAKMGFMMGAAAGGCVGLITGTFITLSSGPAPGRTYLGTISSYVLQHGTMLGFFLSIGSMIRGDSDSPLKLEYQPQYSTQRPTLFGPSRPVFSAKPVPLHVLHHQKD